MKFFARFFSKKGAACLLTRHAVGMPPADEITPPVLLAAKCDRQ
jgi:hypothetical protein